MKSLDAQRCKYSKSRGDVAQDACLLPCSSYHLVDNGNLTDKGL